MSDQRRVTQIGLGVTDVRIVSDVCALTTPDNHGPEVCDDGAEVRKQMFRWECECECHAKTLA